MSTHRFTGLFGKLHVRLITYALVAAMFVLLRTGCAAQSPAQQSSHTDKAAFASAEYDIRLAYPDDLQRPQANDTAYLGGDAWKAYAGPDAAPGKRLLTLVMPQSNDITTGALRIGVSRDATAVDNCTTLPSAALPDSVGKTTIDGVTFTTYTARDAGMSHYRIAHSYRAVHDHTCYAMDVLVHGTNPEVYAPPREAPFTHKQAFARLQPVAEGLRFTSSTD